MPHVTNKSATAMSGEDVQYGYPDNADRDYVFESDSCAKVEGLIDEEGHLQAKDLWGVQKRLLHVSMPVGSTLESLQQNHRNGVYWDLGEEFKQNMRQIVSSRNRKNAGAEERAGDTAKMLIVGAKFISHTNDSKKAFGLDIPGLVREAGDGQNMYNYIVSATMGNPCNLGIRLENPDNMFTRTMYEQKQKMDLQTLKRAINRENPANPKIALMPTNMVGWKVLVQNMEPDGAFADVAETILQMNEPIFQDIANGVERDHYAQVPIDTANVVFDAIAEPLKKFEASYVNLDEFRIKWVPADGQAWTHSNGLINETAGRGFAGGEGAEKSSEISRPINASVYLQLEYILDE